jgi:ribose-phosphate pyrophosphokinase
MAASDGPLKVFSGRAHPALAQEVAACIGIPLGEILIESFQDGETRVVINENVRGVDAFIIQPTFRPNETLLELLIVIDAMRRASARRVTAVIPYFGYARQDRKTRGREPITAKLVANLLVTAGADRVLTVDLHAGQIQGFFDVPVDHLTGIPLLARRFAEMGLEDVVVVCPDAGEGGIPRARRMAELLSAPLAIVDKRRPAPNVAEVMNVIGNVRGKTAILVDDIIDTAGTIVQAAYALRELGAREVYTCCVHPLLSGPAVERLRDGPGAALLCTNTIPLPPHAQEVLGPRLQVLSIAPLLADAIVRVHEDRSITELMGRGLAFGPTGR